MKAPGRQKNLQDVTLYLGLVVKIETATINHARTVLPLSKIFITAATRGVAVINIATTRGVAKDCTYPKKKKGKCTLCGKEEYPLNY